jgi:hypothetical protein
MAWTLGDNVDKYRKMCGKFYGLTDPPPCAGGVIMWLWRWRWRAALQHRKRNLARRRPTIATILDRTTEGKYYLFSFSFSFFFFAKMMTSLGNWLHLITRKKKEGTVVESFVRDGCYKFIYTSIQQRWMSDASPYVTS